MKQQTPPITQAAQTTQEINDQAAQPEIIHYKRVPKSWAWFNRLAKGQLTMRQHLVFLIFMLFLPLLAIEIYSVFSEYQTQRQIVLEGQATNARSVSRTLTSFINERVASSRAIGLNFVRQTAPSQERGNLFLADYRKYIPYLSAVRVFDLNGQTLYADPPALVGTNVSQEPAFQELLKLKPEATTIPYRVTDLQRSVVDNTTPVFTILVLITDENNQPLRVVGAVVNTLNLSQVFDVKMGVRSRGSISIHDRQAVLIYNSQFPELTFEQRNNRATESVKQALKGQEMLLPFVKSTLDGLDKMGASTPVIALGWSASVAEPIEDAMSPTLNLIIPRLSIFTLVAVIAILAAWVYSRYLALPLVSLRKVAVAFGQGDMQRRTTSSQHNVLEVAELSSSFNQMADRIERETHARDTFLAQAAHELKTPITVIKGTTQLIIGRLKKAEATSAPPDLSSLSKNLKNIEHQTNRMTDLVTRLLEQTRLQAGKMEYQFEQVNFLGLLERCLEAATQLSPANKHQISFESAVAENKTPEVTVRVDTARIEQVILNLLENAIKYSPEGGLVKVGLELKKADGTIASPYLVLSIKDSGIGLSPSDAARIFERYYRAETPGVRVSGLGLGLYISSEIVRQHGGQLWAKSSGPNQGSTFYLALPLEQAEEISALPVTV